MDTLREQFFSCSGFPGYQHNGIYPTISFCFAYCLPQLGAIADYFIKFVFRCQSALSQPGARTALDGLNIFHTLQLCHDRVDHFVTFYRAQTANIFFPSALLQVIRDSCSGFYDHIDTGSELSLCQRLAKLILTLYTEYFTGLMIKLDNISQSVKEDQRISYHIEQGIQLFVFFGLNADLRNNFH